MRVFDLLKKEKIRERMLKILQKSELGSGWRNLISRMFIWTTRSMETYENLDVMNLL